MHFDEKIVGCTCPRERELVPTPRGDDVHSLSAVLCACLRRRRPVARIARPSARNLLLQLWVEDGRNGPVRRCAAAAASPLKNSAAQVRHRRFLAGGRGFCAVRRRLGGAVGRPDHGDAPARPARRHALLARADHLEPRVRRKERERLGEGEGARQQEDQPPARDERGRGEGEEVGEDRLERRGHRAGDMRGELRLLESSLGERSVVERRRSLADAVGRVGDDGVKEGTRPPDGRRAGRAQRAAGAPRVGMDEPERGEQPVLLEGEVDRLPRRLSRLGRARSGPHRAAKHRGVQIGAKHARAKGGGADEAARGAAVRVEDELRGAAPRQVGHHERELLMK
mmetsp:Transcript_5778/g.18633  ORF Transcript_5778/g.18633 Transcript_5778/m.18633 type:complete len:340 (-) Transcript_5778:203-1222(-)